jgi:hypothetical protein
MPARRNVNIGDRFGSRVITEILDSRDAWGQILARWNCDCGASGVTILKALWRTTNCLKCHPGNADSLGHVPVHGQAGKRTHLYDTWANMMQRVRGTGSERNKRWYAGKGITACDDWQKFEGFRDWAVANGYEPGLSLDRKFATGNYEPNNCEWITRQENSRRGAEDVWRRFSDAMPANGLLSMGV